MPHSNSAKKRLRQNEAQRLRNKAYRSRYRGQLKKSAAAIALGEVETAETAVRQTGRVLDKVATKGVIHRRKAARLKSRLARKLNAAKKAAAAAPQE